MTTGLICPLVAGTDNLKQVCMKDDCVWYVALFDPDEINTKTGKFTVTKSCAIPAAAKLLSTFLAQLGPERVATTTRCAPRVDPSAEQPLPPPSPAPTRPAMNGDYYQKLPPALQAKFDTVFKKKSEEK